MHIKALVNLPLVIARETLARQEPTRVPEPMAMDEPESVAQFEEAGRASGPLVPVYELAARTTSRLAGRGARLLDLGCGPANHLAYLAARRPDLAITGLDLAPNMLARGSEVLAREGVADQVDLVEGDMTDFADRFADQPIDVISSVFALHHLPTEEHLSACLAEIAKVRERTGCGIVLFDLGRMRDPDSWRRVLAATSPELLSTEYLERDSIVSGAAAWSFAEMKQALAEAGLGEMKHRRSLPIAGFQLHHLEPRGDAWRGGDSNWQSRPMPMATRIDVVPLKLMFRQAP